MKITFDISQKFQNEMLSQVRFYQKRKKEQIRNLIEDTVHSIATDAQGRVPKRSGDLVGEIKVLLDDLASEMRAYAVAEKFYARFVEIGTAKAAAHPFMHPAAEAHIPGYLAKLAKILRSP